LAIPAPPTYTFFDAYGHRHDDRHGDADAHEAAQAGR
jgi:hypothetical protein